ncbi:MAG TPA: SLATT domain-containing protein [Pseudonocardiaceae bacterium]
MFRLRRRPPEPIQSAMPGAGLTPLELAHDLVARIETANRYARTRKHRFRNRSSLLKVAILAMSATSTVILGLQNLDGWTGTAFALVAVTTVIGTLEPFFAWRSRWVLMEEAQSQFYRLRDDVTYYLAATPTPELEPAVIRELFERYQAIWVRLEEGWLEHRRTTEHTA